MLRKTLNSFAELEGKYTSLLAGYKPVVLGEGHVGANIFMIGEAPGKSEVDEGRPFVGQAGKNLDEFLEFLELERKDIYITNAVKFRPVKINAHTGRLSNRAPTTKEIECFHPMLMDEIELINPLIIITLGNIPLMSLAGKNIRIGNVHGKPMEHEGRTLYPLYHPASIIYRKELKAVYWEDLKRLKPLLPKKI